MNIAVIGGGPAGIMAAGAASDNNKVTLFEKNEKLCKKLFITGKGRCNITNNCSEEEFLSNIVTNKRFMYSAIKAFSPEDTINFFKEQNCPLKTERGKRVFPVSDKSSDIISALEKYLKNKNVTVKLFSNCRNISLSDNGFTLVTDKGNFNFDKVILCGGGASYPQTGSNGQIFNIIKNLGHSVTDLKPALCPIILKEDYICEMAGLSLKNINVKAFNGGKKLFEQQGEMLFTHNGISGPLILSMSSYLNKYDLKNVEISIDLKPALEEKTLINRINRDFLEAKNKMFKNSLNALLPKSLIPIIIKLSDISPDIMVNSITSEKRRQLALLLKNLKFKVKSLGAIEGAIVTSGGVCVKEVNPSTMESKIVKGLYFAGEVIDIDALTGGFNLQTALSTGFVAGTNAGKSEI